MNINNTCLVKIAGNSGRENYLIWGSSVAGSAALELLRSKGHTVVAFCDNSEEKQGTTYLGVPVVSPWQAKELIAAGKNWLIVIASIRFDSIYQQIESLGIECPIYLYLFSNPCDMKTGRFQFSDYEKKQIRRAYFKDDYTQTLLNLILDEGLLNENRFESIEPYRGYEGVGDYFYDSPKDLLNDESYTLLDIGAYTGDSIRQIKTVLNDKLSKVYAFEPDPETRSLITSLGIETSIEVFPYALSNVSGTKSFGGGQEPLSTHLATLPEVL